MPIQDLIMTAWAYEVVAATSFEPWQIVVETIILVTFHLMQEVMMLGE